MEFNPIEFVKNLKYMGVGMLGVFIVIFLIFVSVKLLSKLFKD